MKGMKLQDEELLEIRTIFKIIPEILKCIKFFIFEDVTCKYCGNQYDEPTLIFEDCQCHITIDFYKNGEWLYSENKFNQIIDQAIIELFSCPYCASNQELYRLAKGAIELIV
jgi:hypothetical protein